MRARRYTVLIADRSSGVVRRVGVSLRPAIAIALGILSVPVLMGLGAKWSARTEIAQLKSSQLAAEVENGNYRQATGELTGQIQSLEGVINDLGERATLDPEQARAMQKLPAVVKSHAVGGVTRTQSRDFRSRLAPPLSSPEDTFGVLRDLLQGLESRLSYVRRNVEKREALAAATPSIWPAHGWLTGTFGGRPDPFTGEPDFHQGIDISTDKGNPVYATADGTVESAGAVRRVRQPDRAHARLRAGDPLRTSEPVQRADRAACHARRHHRLSSARPAGRPARICTTKSSPTAGRSTRYSSSPRPSHDSRTRSGHVRRDPGVDLTSPQMLQSSDTHSRTVHAVDARYPSRQSRRHPERT